MPCQSTYQNSNFLKCNQSTRFFGLECRREKRTNSHCACDNFGSFGRNNHHTA